MSMHQKPALPRLLSLSGQPGSIVSVNGSAPPLISSHREVQLFPLNPPRPALPRTRKQRRRLPWRSLLCSVLAIAGIVLAHRVADPNIKTPLDDRCASIGY